MEALNKLMDIEDIIREYNGCKFSNDIGKILETKDITFEVIDSIVCIKSKPVDHDFAKNTINIMIHDKLREKSLKCVTMNELRILRGENYGTDFLIPDISVVDTSEGKRGKNGMYLGVPKLVIEIMSSNRYDDIFRKRLLYEEMGVAEYWIVDLDGQWVTQLVLKDGSYGEQGIVKMKGDIEHHLCGLKLNIKNIFDMIKETMGDIDNEHMKPTK